LGHAAGDKLLIQVAAALRQELGPRAFIARLGGDEFAVLAEGGGTSDGELTGLADRLIAKLSVPVDLAEAEASVGATIRIALPAAPPRRSGARRPAPARHAAPPVLRGQGTRAGAAPTFPSRSMPRRSISGSISAGICAMRSRPAR